MDRSFLSLTPIIKASRGFVCIRTLTYEDPEERDFQRSLFIGRSGDVENTTFCALSPDAKRRITWAGRGIGQVFSSPDEMAKWMDQAASYYEDQRRKTGLKPESIAALPLSATVRLGLNTAAADNVPLVILYGTTQAEEARLKAAAAALAWSQEFIGRFSYVSATRAADLSPLDSRTAKPGLLAIQPTRFGLMGKVLSHAAPSATPAQLAEALREGLKLFQPRQESGFDYRRAAQAAGAFWEPKLPVTDIDEAQARERYRQDIMPPRN